MNRTELASNQRVNSPGGVQDGTAPRVATDLQGTTNDSRQIDDENQSGNEAASPVEKANRKAEASSTPTEGYELIGAIVELMMKSPPHRSARLTDIANWILPPMRLGQCRVLRHKGRPHAFVAWALVDDDVVQNLKDGKGMSRIEDWHSGHQVVITEAVAPNGKVEPLLSWLRESIFQNEGHMMVLQTDAKSTIVSLQEFMDKGQHNSSEVPGGVK